MGLSDQLSIIYFSLSMLGNCHLLVEETGAQLEINKCLRTRNKSQEPTIGFGMGITLI